MALMAVMLMLTLLASDGWAQGQPQVEIVPITGHSQSTTALAFSPEGTRVASASGDGVVKLWDSANGRLIRTFVAGSSATVYSIAFSPDGTRFVAGYSDRTAKVWDTTTGRLIYTLPHPDFVASVAFSPDGTTILSGAFRHAIRSWDAASGRLIRAIGEGVISINSVPSVGFSPDGSRALVANGSDDSMSLWDPIAARLVWTVASGGQAVWAVAFSPDGGQAVSGDRQGNLKIWDTATQQLVRTIPTGHSFLDVVVFSPDGTRILSGDSLAHRVRLWDAKTARFLGELEASLGFKSVAFSRDGSRLILGGDNTSFNLWDVATLRLVRTFEGQSLPVASVAFSPDGYHAVWAGGDALIKLADVTSGELIRTLRGHSDAVSAVAFSKDGKRVLSGSSDRTLRLWDTASGQLVQEFKGHGKGTATLRMGHGSGGTADGIAALALSPDGSRALSSGYDETIRLWDTATGKPFWSKKQSGVVRSVAFSPDGSVFVSGGEDRIVRLWDVKTGLQIRSFGPNSHFILALAFSPDGRLVAAGTWDKPIKFWDVATGKLVRMLEGHADYVTSLAFSPDGSQIASGSLDRTTKLWQIATGTLVATFEARSTGIVYALASSRNGARYTSPGEIGGVAVSFSPDGKRLLSGSSDGFVKIWNTGSMRSAATFFNLSNGEWLTTTDAGFFASSANGDKMVSIVRGLRTYSVSQFFDQLYHPDLVQDLLKGDPELKYEDAAKRLDLQKIIDTGPPPQIALLDKQTELANSSVLISIRLFNNAGGGVGKKLIWRVNGVTQGETTAPELQNLQDPNGPVVVRHGLRLDPSQENLVSVTAYNGADLFATEPLIINVDRFGVSAGPRPKMYVLGIAVDHYESDSGLRALQFATGDVTALAKALKNVGERGGYEKVEILPPLLDDDAVRDKIAQAFANLRSTVKPWDAFILILAGHGRSVLGRGYFYYPHDAKLGDGHTVLTDGINADQWRDWLAMAETTKRLLIIDTCESAEAIAIERGGDSLVRESAIDRIREATGHSVITASRQIAYEGSVLGHGILSYAILEALATPRSDQAAIDVKDIDRFVYDEVPKLSLRLSGVEQRPYDKIVGNFVVGQPLQSVLPSPPPPCGTDAVPYFLLREETIRTKPAADAEPTRTEQAGYKVEVAEHFGSWDKVCRQGMPIGYVPHDALVRER